MPRKNLFHFPLFMMMFLLFGAISCVRPANKLEGGTFTLPSASATKPPVSFSPEYSEKSVDCQIFLSPDDLAPVWGNFISMSLDESGKMYLYSPEQQRIFVFSESGDYLHEVILPSIWADPSGNFPLIYVPVAKNKIWFPMTGNLADANFGKVIGTMNLHSRKVETFSIPQRFDVLQRRRIFLDETGMYVITERTLGHHPQNV